ncbi:hypothetical protein AB9K26_07070 [Psychroserpens sp. XS_ASV72]|uniref:hypothetical protein n=1 Tax=Psychroserpens sp. XS_ASV72 TaxID=3241293 RepID=UPI0035171632
MKALNYALAVIATLLLLFCLNGILKPKVSFELFAKIDKPIEKSWPLLQDKFNLSNLLEDVQETEYVYGNPGTIGSASDIYINSDGNHQIIRQVITEITPNKSISILSESKFKNVEYQLSAVEHNDTTYLTSKITYKGNNLFTKSYIALTGSSLVEKEELNFRNFLNSVSDTNLKKFNAIE